MLKTIFWYFSEGRLNDIILFDTFAYFFNYNLFPFISSQKYADTLIKVY